MRVASCRLIDPAADSSEIVDGPRSQRVDWGPGGGLPI